MKYEWKLKCNVQKRMASGDSISYSYINPYR